MYITHITFLLLSYCFPLMILLKNIYRKGKKLILFSVVFQEPGFVMVILTVAMAKMNQAVFVEEF